MPAALTRTRTFPGPGTGPLDFYHLQDFHPAILIESHCTRHTAFTPFLLVAWATRMVAETKTASLLSTLCIVA